MSDVMLDIETLSTYTDAIILSIAGIKFSPTEKHKTNYKNYFYKVIDIDSCKKIGLKENSETRKWWEGQSVENKKELFNPKNAIDIKTALYELSLWLGEDADKIRIWCQGPHFDIPILENAYRLCSLKIPWKYYNVRDTRTVYDLTGFDTSKLPKENKHNALSDCKNQIWGLKESLKLINLS
jgi:hypothetical protein